MVTQKEKVLKPYQKPQVERVRLVVEEAVLAGCKQSGTTQPGYADCNVGLNYCSALGS